jgi:predicted SnoaL-like aldol condensation-catalyzing enzyme
MKKKLTFLTASVMLLFTACSNDKKKEETPVENKASAVVEKNLQAVHKINDFFKTGDARLIEQAIAVGAIDHATAGEPLVASNMDTVKAYFLKMRNSVEITKMELVKEWADEEYVVQWMRMSGVSKDASSGMPPGQKFENMEDLHINRMKDGKTVEHWEFMQPADLMKMMAPPQGK